MATGPREDPADLCPLGCYWQCEHRLAASGAPQREEFWLAEHNVWPPPMRAADHDWQRWIGVRPQRHRRKGRR